MAAVYSWPTIIQISLPVFSKQNQQFVHNWQPALGIFLCDKTTEFGRQGENLVIMIADSRSGPWFVAVEGVLAVDGFQARREAFRTQEQFWHSDWHEWQVNKINVCGTPDWEISASRLLIALTRIPGNANFVALSSGLQLAMTH